MNMGERLMREIETFWNESKSNHSFFKGIIGERMDPSILSTFVSNTEYIVGLTPVHLDIARKEANESGDQALADYFALKIAEESGHDKWAQEDIKKLELKGASQANLQHLESMKEIARYNEALIKKDPYQYLVYILFTEYFTVIAADECFSGLGTHSNISKDDLTVISKHAELDKEHVGEFRETFSSLPQNRMPSEESLRKTLHDIFKLYQSFWTELMNGSERSAA